MKRITRFCLLAGMAFVSIARSSAQQETPWPFFAFDNGVGRGVWSASRQAETVKNLGYDGIHFNYINPKDFATKLAACGTADVPIHAVYIHTFVDQPGESYDPSIRDMIRLLKGSQSIIWMTLRDGVRGKQDVEAARVVREIAALAAESELKVSLYPHAGFYVATAEDAVRIAKIVDLPHVGVTVNLCHELFAGNGDRLAEVVEAAAPYLNLVSINGASPIPGNGSKDWETLPLGSGTFDTAAFLRLIRDTGYRGPIGHQFYAVAGDDMRKLSLAIGSWKRMKPAILEPGTP